MAGFLGGLALFTIASAACAASPNLWSLVAFRGLQAVGAAALTPTSLGLLLAATPAERRDPAPRPPADKITPPAPPPPDRGLELISVSRHHALHHVHPLARIHAPAR